MNWQRLKDELREALREAVNANVTVTLSPHTVQAVIREVEDLRRLLRKLDKAMVGFLTCDYSYETLHETYLARLRKLTTIQGEVRELIG